MKVKPYLFGMLPPARRAWYKIRSNVLSKRFEKFGRIEDLDDSIICLHKLLALSPSGHQSRPVCLNQVANLCLERFEQTDEVENLEEAIQYGRQSLLLCPTGHHDRVASLDILAIAIYTRFQRTSRLEDLKEVVMYYREVLLLRPPGHPDHATALNDLVNALHTQFEHTGGLRDLEEAIGYGRQALSLRPSGHPDRAVSLNSLAAAISTRFEHNDKMQDLVEVITLYRESLSLRPLGHPNRAGSLNNLAAAICTRFGQTGEMQDLEEAIEYSRQSLALFPPGHPNRAYSLSNLAVSIHTYFEQKGGLQDLKEAIGYYREALDLYPLGHPERSSALGNLAGAIHTRFEHTGDMEDSEDSIRYHRESLVLRPPGHPDRSASLNGLGAAIYARFEQTGRAEDLEEAITYHQQALALRPAGHTNRRHSLSNLAVAFHARFEQRGEVQDLEDAIAYYRDSVDLHPPDHPARFLVLSNLALAIWTRFEQNIMESQLEDLEEAITYHRQSLSFHSPGHPDHPHSLSNLAAALYTRFERTGGIEDLHDSAEFLSNAETALPAEHPLHTTFRLRLASIYLKMHDLDSKTEHLLMAFAFFEMSANHNTASVKARFTAALQWAYAARRHHHESTIHAYHVTSTLLGRYLIQAPIVELQQKFLTSTVAIPKSLASDAASSAIEAGQLDIAVEFLEQGRGILWSKMRGYRPSIEALRKVDPELAGQFERLSSQLEHQALSSESRRWAPEQYIPFEVVQQRYRRLSEEWNKVVARIRLFEGFADFLKTVPFDKLRQAAAEGPVIIVNISEHRSDAIIVRHVDPLILVPIPEAEPTMLARLASPLSDPRAASSDNFSRTLSVIVRTLWNSVVHPVTDQLCALGVAENNRIWWCPTSDLCALPIHAAGPYARNQKNLPDLYISSYTPTLAALITARSGTTPCINTPNLLVIGDVGPPDAPIPEVEQELHRIQQLGNFVNVLVGERANRNNVIDELRQHSWVHFACHGQRNPQPFQSSFRLHDGERLELLDLIKARLPDAEHAFLSACHAAAADIKGAPDEVIHLAAALQFCGFKSVVGTLWAMEDIDGPDVAEDFYRYMFRTRDNRVDFRDSAIALNLATIAMRRKGMPLGRWVNFIHIGA